ncbi:MAG: hypothetical protein WCG07_03195 [Candidatus Taylorbacteria bacterium]
MNQKILTYLSIILGIIFIVGAVVYWIVPAGSLPSFMPGFIEGSTKIHFKHGLGSGILGLTLFAYAWFRSGKK